MILVAESFSEYDKYAVNRIGANIELWTFRKYGEDFLYFDPLFVAAPQPTKGTAVLTTVDPEAEEPPETQVITPVYTLEDHTSRKPKDIVDLFERLRESIFGLAEEGEITEKANKMYIGYKHGKNFCEIRLQNKLIQIWLDISPSDLVDPLKMVRDVSNIGHYGTGDSEIKLSEVNNIDQVMNLIEQSFRLTI